MAVAMMSAMTSAATTIFFICFFFSLLVFSRRQRASPVHFARFDFFEPVNTLCLPYLAKNNIRLYALKVWKIGILNILFYSFGLLIFGIVRYLIFYYQTNLLDQFLISLNFGYEFALLPGLAFMINNFLRGMVEFRFY